MRLTTTFSAFTKTVLLASAASITTIAYADVPDGVLEVTSARAWVSSTTLAKETTNFTQDDCENHRNASSFHEMFLESECSAWVDAPDEDFEELASWAGAQSYAGVDGREVEADGQTGFVLLNILEASLSTDPESSAYALSQTWHVTEFSLNERAKVRIEACFATQEYSFASVRLTNDDSQESEFSFAVTGLYDDCQELELELPAGNYTLRTHAEGELTGHGEREIEAAMGAGLVARALTPAERADINRDGVVDGNDLLKVLAYWGSDIELVDLNQDGIVNGGDITVLFAYWN